MLSRLNALKRVSVRWNSTAAAQTPVSVPEAEVVVGRGVQLPTFHPRTHDIPVANIHFRSHHIRLLDLITHFATHAASSLGIPTSQVVYLPTQRSLWTVIRSPFAHKKSQENFERKVHKRAIKAWDADPEVVERWVKYIRANALGGVGMKVTRWQYVPIGVGETRYKEARMHIGQALERRGKIKLMGEKIIEEELRASEKGVPQDDIPRESEHDTPKERDSDIHRESEKDIPRESESK